MLLQAPNILITPAELFEKKLYYDSTLQHPTTLQSRLM